MGKELNQQGLVISYYGNRLLIEALNGQRYQCLLKRNQITPVVGDQVLWRLQNDQSGVILDILKRKSELTRGDRLGNRKVLASNVDYLIIMMPPPPAYSPYLIDRYIVAALLSNLVPIVIVNKMDLLDESERRRVKEALSLYQQLKYKTLLTSIFTMEGISDLEKLLQDRSAVLVGPSGVGKSSMIRILTKIEDIRVNEVSDKGTGKHTTTATQLYHLPNGGYLIDSPGVREFNLWSVTPFETLSGFAEMAALEGECQFANCQHLDDQTCAIIKALVTGEISESRYKSFTEILKMNSNNKKTYGSKKNSGKDQHKYKKNKK